MIFDICNDVSISIVKDKLIFNLFLPPLNVWNNHDFMHSKLLFYLNN